MTDSKNGENLDRIYMQLPGLSDKRQAKLQPEGNI